MNDRNTELKEVITQLLDKINDEKTLRAIYRYINDLYCHSK